MSKAINIYQIFTRLFRNDAKVNKPFGTISENGCSKFDDFTPLALNAIKEMGITHIWFTGILQHATCSNYEAFGIPSNNPKVVKGRAGSPYAITDYYDVCPDLAVNPTNRMLEFGALVNRCHQLELGVIIDFVPNHVAREYHGNKTPQGIPRLGENDKEGLNFSPANNFYYITNQGLQLPQEVDFPYTKDAEPYMENPAKATGNNVFSASPSINDWYETVKLNYGVDFQGGGNRHFDPIPNTWHQMLHIMMFWAAKGIDGLRCDMVEMVPLEFWEWAIPQVKSKYHKLIFIAEVYNPLEYELFLEAGFDFLYDKVGLYDILRQLVEGHGSAQNITALWQRYEGFSHRMLRFLENHDEQRIASKHFADNPWLAIPAMVLSATMSTGPMMLYFGQELGESAQDNEGFSGYDGRTTIFDYWHVSLYQKWVNRGQFTQAQLTQEQQNLRSFYKILNRLRLESSAISNGNFYDLMWGNEHLNRHKIYAYLRFYQDEIFLFVLNFDIHHGHQVQLKIPTHAIGFASLDKKEQWSGVEILKGVTTIKFSVEEVANSGVCILLGKADAAVYRLL